MIAISSQTAITEGWGDRSRTVRHGAGLTAVQTLRAIVTSYLTLISRSTATQAFFDDAQARLAVTTPARRRSAGIGRVPDVIGTKSNA